MNLLGYAGVIALALCWIPQSVDTIKAGRCDVTLGFLVLSATGSLLVMVYALMRADMVFSILNALTTSGATINLYYKLFPRRS